MIGDRGGILHQASIQANNEIEKIAAELVLNGEPLWDAILKARKIYKLRKASEKVKQSIKTIKGEK